MNQSVATIRSLVIDTINKANSGHPGMALGSAPALYQLFNHNLITTPENSGWINRDRFVLASGHASTLLYSLLHLSGFNISIDDLKQFRQWNSVIPGHPEYKVSHGVDASSGPLGQGVPTAVGMALAEKLMRKTYPSLINHYTYVLCGDGDMQEGVTQEAAQLAGLWGLGKLIVLYDSNEVTLDGKLEDSNKEDTKKRFEAMGWQVLEVIDGEDLEEIQGRLDEAKVESEKPSLIIIHTIIGFGSKHQGTSKVHGSPLGEEDGNRAKEVYGFKGDKFEVPAEVYEDFTENKIKRGNEAYQKWCEELEKIRIEEPEKYQEFLKEVNGEATVDFSELEKKIIPGYVNATRNISQEILNVIADQLPNFYSGAADLASSTKTVLKDKDKNIAFGIREFAMVAIINGVNLHGGIKMTGGCFLVFSDYCKAALRMAALNQIPTTILFSHDSIAVGEDGPTHQPVEQINGLRMIPNFRVFRPCDGKELIGAYKMCLESKNTPAAICLTRQNVPTIGGSKVEAVENGAYIVSKEDKKIDCILIATGSEVDWAIKAKEQLAGKIDIRVVSMPCMELFDMQVKEYCDEILPTEIEKRVFIEMGNGGLAYKYTGLKGKVIDVNSFGQSAPAGVLVKEYGFTVERVVEEVERLMAQ